MISQPMVLHCPECGFIHVDRDEWATKPHKTHLCEVCGNLWRPSALPTVGIDLDEWSKVVEAEYKRLFLSAWCPKHGILDDKDVRVTHRNGGHCEVLCPDCPKP